MPRKHRPLSEATITKILCTIPEVRDRARIFKHLSINKAWEGRPYSPEDEELMKIVTYLRSTNNTGTVRAKYGLKLAAQLEQRAHREGE